MKIVVRGLSKEQIKKVDPHLSRTAKSFANGDGVDFIYPAEPASGISVEVEGAKYIAPTRLKEMLQEELTRLIAR